MTGRKRAIFAVFAALLAGTAASSGAPLERRGVAVLADSGRGFYTEGHRRDPDSAGVVSVRYLAAGTNALLARRVVRFRTHATAPDVEYWNFQDRVLTRVRHGTAGFAISTHTLTGNPPAEGAPLTRNTLTVPEPAVLDLGLNEFIRRNGKVLATGAALDFNLVVPARSAYYRFRLSKFGARSQKNRLALRLAPAGVLAWLVDDIVLICDADDYRLLVYEGPSELKDARGETRPIRVSFAD